LGGSGRSVDRKRPALPLWAIQLADAYSHLQTGYPFGGINPGALAAARQLPPGTPIWSTNIASYCTVPNCMIQSVISFKMSSRLDQILTGSPELAKQLLQEADLNYFLFMKDYQLLDLLPYSHLFAPDTIGQYLGIKWTDNSTFLLTWRGSDTTPIGPNFLEAYTTRLNEPEHPWIRFKELIPHMAPSVAWFRSSRSSWTAADFPWRYGIDVISASYGRNCHHFTPKAPFTNRFSEGNATVAVRKACSRSVHCTVLIDVRQWGDPANGCMKDFSVTYRCPPKNSLKTVFLEPEAHGKTVVLDCDGEAEAWKLSED
jgi:hypothetical protein